jgi:heme exporter protein C
MTAATRLLGGAAFIALATTVVLGLGLPPTQEQGEYVRLVAIHPPLAWASYLAFGLCALASVLYLVPRTRKPAWDHVAGASAEVGVVFTALTLVTGSIWGRPTWGVWWVWDARLTLTALLLFLFLGYLALRRVQADPATRAKRSAVAALLAVLVVPVNHYAVEWWRTLHQQQSLTLSPQENLDGNYIAVMMLGFVAMTLVFAWLTLMRYRVEKELDAAGDVALEAALAERRAEAVPAR